MSLLNWVLTVVLGAGALAGWVFVIGYTHRWTWWRDEHGAHLGFFTLSLTLIMTVYVFRPLFNPVTFAIIRAPLFVAVVACMVWRLVLFLKSDRRRRLRRDVR